MKEILDAILNPDSQPADFAALPLPQAYRAVSLHRDEEHMFDGVRTATGIPAGRCTLTRCRSPSSAWARPLVAVMASSVNYNTAVERHLLAGLYLRLPAPLREALAAERPARPAVSRDRLGPRGRRAAHRPGVNAWKPGEEVVAHCLSVELESADGHNDTMLDPEQRIWGYETNFGGLAELALVKTNQLMPKPRHLTWEEAATPGLVNSTAFRQLVSDNGASMKQGHNVLIWGASGGLGAYATQYALAGGAIPICVVSSEHKAELCRSMGAELIINRAAEGYQFWKDENTQDPKEWKRFGARIRELTGGEDPDIVFEHPGRETFGASVYVTRRGGTIVTCASTSGFMHEYDNRYLWMSLKRIIGSHFANYREAWQANRLIAKGMIHPTMSAVYPLEKTGQAALDVHRNLHHGKVAVLCLAPHEGLGVRDHLLREKHLTEINRFRNE